MDDVNERVRTLFAAKDKAGDLLRDTLAPLFVYTARVAPPIGDLNRRNRSRDAAGLRLGDRAVRDHRMRSASARVARHRTPTAVIPALCSRRTRRRTQRLRDARVADRQRPVFKS
ncbi:MAG: hypothetical protein QM736_24670 [Vicinamibacterales bacterium]